MSDFIEMRLPKDQMLSILHQKAREALVRMASEPWLYEQVQKAVCDLVREEFERKVKGEISRQIESLLRDDAWRKEFTDASVKLYAKSFLRSAEGKALLARKLGLLKD